MQEELEEHEEEERVVRGRRPWWMIATDDDDDDEGDYQGSSRVDVLLADGDEETPELMSSEESEGSHRSSSGADSTGSSGLSDSDEDTGVSREGERMMCLWMILFVGEPWKQEDVGWGIYPKVDGEQKPKTV